MRPEFSLQETLSVSPGDIENEIQGKEKEMADDEKPLSTLVFFQPIEPGDLKEIEGKTTRQLITFLLLELSVIGLGLEELSARMAAAPREGRRRMAPVNGRQKTIDGTLQMELF